MTTIGIIGSGRIGSNVARAAVAAGYDVVLSNSRGPATLGDLVEELGERASAATPEQAAERGDLVLVAVPLGKIDQLPAEALAGKVVMDANNYYPQRDGRIAALDANTSTTSGLLQALAPSARVVKTFNNIYAHEIPQDGTPVGTENRRALPIAGDDEAAKHLVASFLDAIGFDAVDLGPLEESWRVERDTPAYGKRTTASELEAILPSVERVQQA
ncbi:NADPH-dependent F420 reductase [Demequina gelatinilytica]|uniref:NADPH-dependent F420 reductase n=1 Tax=Demequina gelatinilytica TaxID=1638980 RepID=UPI0007847D7B|nr:NAD(P)-binding domain-containing protein [Demequina gelatinilytica]